MAGNWKMCKTVDEAMDLVRALLGRLGTVSNREVVMAQVGTGLDQVSSEQLLNVVPTATATARSRKPAWPSR
jgi:triosephosphate isomerase